MLARALAAVPFLLASTAAAAPLVVSDPSSVNVCERVPGADVAKALGKTLQSERPIVFKDSKLSRCVSFCRPSGLGKSQNGKDPCDPSQLGVKHPESSGLIESWSVTLHVTV